MIIHALNLSEAFSNISCALVEIRNSFLESGCSVTCERECSGFSGSQTKVLGVGICVLASDITNHSQYLCPGSPTLPNTWLWAVLPVNLLACFPLGVYNYPIVTK